MAGAAGKLFNCFRNLFARLYICSETEVKLSSVFLGCSVKNEGNSHVIHLTFTFVANLKLRTGSDLLEGLGQTCGLWRLHRISPGSTKHWGDGQDCHCKSLQL